MAGRKSRSAGLWILAVIIVCLLLLIVGCGGQESKGRPENVPSLQEKESAETDLEPADQEQAEADETRKEGPELFIKMLENHPLHREGALSPDNRYYAYEERSSIILVRLPAVGEYTADQTEIPRIVFADGRRKESSFAEMEADYARRLQEPLLTDEELDEARGRLRSVHDWNNFYCLIYSRDGRYLAYLGYSGFGRDRNCTVYVLDLQDDLKLYTLPVEENDGHAEISWQDDNQTLELYLPWAERTEEGYLALRRWWRLPSGGSRLAYYTQDGAGAGEEVSPADAEKAIAEYARTEAERNRAAEAWAQLSVEQRIASLSAEQVAEEYARYYSLAPEQIRELREKGYSAETIAGMDSLDFEQEEEGWPLSEQSVRYIKGNYPELENEDLSQWTYKDLADYEQPLMEAHNAPPEELKQEMLSRGLPADLTSQVAKEFHGWDSMLSYTNEAIMVMYEAVQQANAEFRKEEAYRLAVREAYKIYKPAEQ